MSRWYYRTSPPIAAAMEAHPALKPLARSLLLPLIGFAMLSLKVGLAPAFVVALLLLGTVAAVLGKLLILVSAR